MMIINTCHLLLHAKRSWLNKGKAWSIFFIHGITGAAGRPLAPNNGVRPGYSEPGGDSEAWASRQRKAQRCVEPAALMNQGMGRPAAVRLCGLHAYCFLSHFVPSFFCFNPHLGLQIGKVVGSEKITKITLESRLLDYDDTRVDDK